MNDFRLISRVDVALHEERAFARKAVAPVVLSDFRSSFPALAYLDDLPEFELPSGFLKLLKQKDYRTRSQYRDPEQSASLVPEALIDHMSIAGTPQEVENRIGAIIDMGVFDEIAIHPVPCKDQTLLEYLFLLSEIITPFLSES
jgi:alkanesulfonate monooxygenase SsuD/methylene tetrahydromethanopterin reductase-like flavin-dependent oxidoreductase (luciferase family)